MPYIINNTRGEIVAVIPDGTTDTAATSLSLVGKNVTPYGEIETENLVKHLENFADANSPENPLEGQIWYDTSEGYIKSYTGVQWKNVSGLYVSSTAPSVEPKVGELWLDTVNFQVKVYAQTDRGLEWITNNRVPFVTSAPDAGLAGDFYFNETSQQLFISDGASWSLIGPPAATGFPGTLWESASLRDLNGDPEPVILGKVNNIVVAVVAKRDFIILPDDRPTGFVELVKGMTYASDASILGTLEHSLTPGNYISGNVYNANSAQTWNINASTSSVANTVVARDSAGNFNANVITANLAGIANNVNGIVSVTNGGTGETVYGNGQLLIGDDGGLSKGTISGSGSITVTNTAGAISIGYSGGTGNGTVSSVGISAGPGISVSDSPVTGSGNITVNNTGVLAVSAGSGIDVSESGGTVTISATGSGVTSINAGSGISVSQSTGDVTISATGGGGGSGDMVLADTQTVTGRKTFTGTENIVAGAYRFTYPEDNGFWYDSNNGNEPYIAVAFEDDQASIRFYHDAFKIEGDSDIAPITSGGSIITGEDLGTAVKGGSGVLGVTHASTPGFGVGVRALALNSNFTGCSVQSEVIAPKGQAYLHFRGYSGEPSGTDPVFTVDSGGNVRYDGVAATPAGDYAEFFEWSDGNPENQDRTGMSVVLEGNKVRIAQSDETPVGIVSAVPGVLGDAPEHSWQGKYLKDDFGRPVMQEYTIYSWKETVNGRELEQTATSLDDVEIPEDAVATTHDEDGRPFKTPMVNPDYDPEAEYKPRSERPEWAPIGLLGKLRILKDQPVNPRWIYMRNISDTVAEYLLI